MRNELRRCFSLAVLFVFFLPFIATTHAADDPVAAGKQAFGAGDYLAALAAFETALREGQNSASLQFNLGVTYYKLGRHAQAEQVFLRAAEDPKLAPRAHQNLGLVHLAMGDRSGAREWFAKAAAGTDDDKQRALAVSAAEALQDIEVPATTDPTASRFNVDLRIRSSLGYDDNVYLSPDEMYIDLARPSEPLVTPDVQSGFFIPLRASGKVNYHAQPHLDLIGEYRFNGDFYIEGNLDNADRTSHILTSGAKIYFDDNDSPRDSFYGGLKVLRRIRSNYDRDTGDDRTVDGQDITDRYTYTSIGIEFQYLKHFGDFRFSLDGEFDDRDYENQIVVTEYDQKRYKIGGSVRYRFSRDTRVTLEYHYLNEDYSERPSRDLMGDVSVTNPTLQYDYHKFELQLRQRLGSDWRAYVTYYHDERQDQFAGYNDYTTSEIESRLLYRGHPRLSAELRLSYWDRNYDNAFAFNNPVVGQKMSDGLEARVLTNYQFKENLALRGEIRYWNSDSNDIRLKYDRTYASIGLEWHY